MTEVSLTARYVVEYVGGGTQVIEVGEDDDIDIAVSELNDGNGYHGIDMIYPEDGTVRIPRHGFDPEDYIASTSRP